MASDTTGGKDRRNFYTKHIGEDTREVPSVEQESDGLSFRMHRTGVAGAPEEPHISTGLQPGVTKERLA